MRADIDFLRKERVAQSIEITELRAKYDVKPKIDYQWRKEGNRKQFELIHDLQAKNQQAIAIFAPYDNPAGNKHLMNTASMLKNRVKMLRIADSSSLGWATVVEYENNPVADDEEDDKKLRRAEKSASDKKQLKDQEKKNRQTRFQPYNNQNYSQGNSSHDRNEGEHDRPHYSGYRSYGG